MNIIVKFFHEMLNPHCQHCDNERMRELEQNEINRICPSCESLKMQLSLVNQQNEKLLNKLVTEKEEIIPIQQEQPRVLNTKGFIPFNVIRNRLETESRIKAQELNAQNKAQTGAAKPDVAKLESELGIENARSEPA